VILFSLSVMAASVAAEEKAPPPQPVAAPLALSLGWKAGAGLPMLDSQREFARSILFGIVADLPLPFGFRQLPNLIFSAKGAVDLGFLAHYGTYNPVAQSYYFLPGQMTQSNPLFPTLGLGARYNLAKWFGVSGDMQIGMYTATTSVLDGADIGQLGLGFRAGVEADLGFVLSGWDMSLGLRGEYANLLGLWQGLTGSIALVYYAPVYDKTKEGIRPESPAVPGQQPSPTASQAGRAAADSHFSLQFTPAFGYTVVNLYPGGEMSSLSLIREDIKVSALYSLPSFPLLRLRADVAVKSNFSTDTFFYGDVGLGVGGKFSGNWDASLFLCEGIVSSYAPSAPATSMQSLLVTSVGIDLSYSFSPTYSIGIEAMLNWINDRYGEVSTGISMAYHFPAGGKRVAGPKPSAQPETEQPAEKPQLLQKPAEQEVPQPEPKETAIVQAAPKQEPAPAKVTVAEQPKAAVPEQKTVAKVEAAPPEPKVAAAQPAAAKPTPAPVQATPKAEPQKPVEERGDREHLPDLPHLLR
jgi:pyruvate/2-oxoglutarate dehydrogenase complex dihydrolipoamide acyltransferase (E2) component